MPGPIPYMEFRLKEGGILTQKLEAIDSIIEREVPVKGGGTRKSLSLVIRNNATLELEGETVESLRERMGGAGFGVVILRLPEPELPPIFDPGQPVGNAVIPPPIQELEDEEIDGSL